MTPTENERRSRMRSALRDSAPTPLEVDSAYHRFQAARASRARARAIVFAFATCAGGIALGYGLANASTPTTAERVVPMAEPARDSAEPRAPQAPAVPPPLAIPAPHPDPEVRTSPTRPKHAPPVSRRAPKEDEARDFEPSKPSPSADPQRSTSYLPDAKIWISVEPPVGTPSTSERATGERPLSPRR